VRRLGLVQLLQQTHGRGVAVVGVRPLTGVTVARVERASLAVYRGVGVAGDSAVVWPAEGAEDRGAVEKHPHVAALRLEVGRLRVGDAAANERWVRRDAARAGKGGIHIFLPFWRVNRNNQVFFGGMASEPHLSRDGR